MDNTRTIRKIFQDSIFEVFEKMFFIFLEVSEKKGMQYHLLASIGFSGRVSGEVKIYIPQAVADLMVQNMLNIAVDEVTDKLRDDCAKESVNMICGDFLRNYDSSAVFDLSLPMVESGPKETAMEKIDSDEKVVLYFDSGKAIVGALLQFV